MLSPTEAIVTAPAIFSAPAISSVPASSYTPAGVSALRNPPCTVPTDPTGLPLAIPEWITTRLPRKGGYPRTRGGCHSSLGSSGDISISHSGVSRGHRNIPHASVNHYTTTPDSSGLRRPTNRTPLCSNGSYPPRPTSHSDILSCAAPARPRTISLHGRTMHNNLTELVFTSILLHKLLKIHVHIFNNYESRLFIQ